MCGCPGYLGGATLAYRKSRALTSRMDEGKRGCYALWSCQMASFVSTAMLMLHLYKAICACGDRNNCGLSDCLFGKACFMTIRNYVPSAKCRKSRIFNNPFFVAPASSLSPLTCQQQHELNPHSWRC